MAVSRLCLKDGALSCPVFGGDETKGTKGGKEAKNKNYKYRKVVTYTNNPNKVDKTKVDAGHNTVETDAIKGLVFKGTTKDYSGEDKTKSYDSGNKGESNARTKYTEFYKDRTKLGAKLAGTTLKQKGGLIETEENGKKTTIVYKGKGKRARVVIEKDEKIEEVEKEDYKTAEKKAEEENGKGISANERVNLNTFTFKKSKVKGDDDNYKLGTKTDTDKAIKGTKKSAKAVLSFYKDKAKKSGAKMTKRGLAKLMENG